MNSTKISFRDVNQMLFHIEKSLNEMKEIKEFLQSLKEIMNENGTP